MYDVRKIIHARGVWGCFYYTTNRQETPNIALKIPIIPFILPDI